MTVLLIFIVPAVMGLGVMTLLRARRLLIVCTGTVLLFVGVFAVAYVSASHGAVGSSCSDCERFAGRYWEPDLVALLALIAATGWCLGAGAGLLIRGLLPRRHSAARSG